MTEQTTKQRYTHAIIYIGAPYGENESGHIVSRHTSRELADSAFDRKFSGTTGVLNNKVVALDANGNWAR